MKKAYISIVGLLLFGSALMAQSPANRTAKTIVADVLAQMPAQKQAEYNKLIGELKGTGEEGVLMLAGKLGEGSNAQVEYALSGLTHFVMAKNEESSRSVVANAYVKALDKVSSREAKAFIIRQLQVIGKGECVNALTSYLKDEKLSGPAARALAANGSEAANKALKDALNQGSAKIQKDVIVAIGEAGVEDTEDLLRAKLGSGDEDMQKVVLHALSCVGTKASIKDLAAAAAASGYTMTKTNANEAYIALLKRVAEQGDIKEVEKAAGDLLKKATKAGQTGTRDAALQILMSVNKEKRTKQLLTALKDGNKEYRNAALTYASEFADKDVYVEVMKAMQKAKPEVKVDVINWIGREAKCPKKHDTVKNLELRFDLTAMQELLSQLKDTNFDVKQAAAWALVKIGDKQAIPALADLMLSEDKQVVLLGQDALAAFNGDIDSDVARVTASAPDAGKVAGLELLAKRNATSKLTTVLEQIKNGTPDVKKAAYTALKDVVSEKDFVSLCGMLETADASAVAPLQQAVISSISSLSTDKQKDMVSRRMLQAGESKKHLYYIVLATTGEKDALATIVKGLHEGSATTKDAAFNALLAWKGMEAVDELYDVCQSSSSSAQQFDAALKRYVELVSNPKFTAENRLIFLRKIMEVAKTTDQRVLILQQIQRADTFLSLMYASEFLDANDSKVRSAAVYAIWNIARNHPEFTGDNVKSILNRILPMFDGQDARYDTDALKKHLAEMPDETGFVSMFNGKDLTGWKGMVEGGNPYKRYALKASKLASEQKKADERMRNDWKVENGCLVYVGSGFDNLCSEKQYGDFELIVDWKLDPNGKEPDAGIYLRATPQVQIWDTSRVNVGAQVGSGGLYNNQTNESKPSKVADNKLGEWNTFHIKMVGDRVTVDMNGERVVDNVIMENYWDRSKPILPIEQIELQAHGSKCYFRNIYVKELERREPYQLSEQEKKEGFQVLFDGTNMYEWQGNTGDYILEDGCISMVPSRSFGGNLYTKKEYANFVYRFEFQLTPGANNGIGIRTPLEGDAAYVGMEIQVLDCEHPIYSDITKYQHHGSVYGIIPAKEGHHSAFKPAGEWNEEEIVANGDYIKVSVNGVVITEGNIRDAVKNGTPDKREHPGLFNKKGYIGFLGHGSPVKFRNIRIKELK